LAAADLNISISFNFQGRSLSISSLTARGDTLLASLVEQNSVLESQK
jgi:hypothetical protein